MEPAMVLPRTLVSVVALVVFAVSQPALAAGSSARIVRGYEPDASDTHPDAVAAFSRTAWLPAHNTFGNGTLIAPDVMLLAAHLLPSTDGAGRNRCDPLYTPPGPGVYSFRFRRKPDGSVGSIAQGQSSFHEVAVREFILAHSGNGGCRDIALAILEEPVTHIQPIRVELDTPPAVGDKIVLAGWGKEGPAFDQGPRGRLMLAETVCTSNSGFIGVPNPYAAPFPPGPNMFDSGGAMLVASPCEQGGYRLVGVIITTTGGTSVPALQGAFRDAVPVFGGECEPHHFVFDRDLSVPVVGGVHAGASVYGLSVQSDDDDSPLDGTFPVTEDGLTISLGDSAAASAAVSAAARANCRTQMSAAVEGDTTYVLLGNAKAVKLGVASSRQHDTSIQRDPLPYEPPLQVAVGAASVFDGTAYHQIRLSVPFSVAGTNPSATLHAALTSTRTQSAPAGGFTVAAWNLFSDLNGNGVADPAEPYVASAGTFVEGSGTHAAPVEIPNLTRGAYVLMVTFFADSIAELYSPRCGETLEASPLVTDDVTLYLTLD